MPAHVGVGPSHVADDEIVLSEMLGQPGGVDDSWKLRHGHPGNLQSRKYLRLGCNRRARLETGKPVGQRRESAEIDAEPVAGVQEPGDIGNVPEPVFRTAEERPLREGAGEAAERAIELVATSLLLAAERVVRIRELAVSEDQQPDE